MKFIPHAGSWTVGMNTYSEKQEAAAEFIKYLTLYDGADVLY